MKPTVLLRFVCTAALTACAQQQPITESPAYAARMREAADRYTACLTGEAEKDMKNPSAAEDIAIAAHGRCWSAWDAYRDSTSASFAHGARTPFEMQYARDKADAHLRQFELETRRTLVDSVVQRTLGVGTPRP